ncbi:acetylornithine deacetylase [Microlunatus capsulatus]|uniref:Acetylornithine deacetylase n=1 Tax=Microlunatus capsulatus TaxID=99117 RepID=A0ABS4Z7E6_9ACTN|nr:acetylornithine deacetylase [Microlunatus capsulatus]MBP2416645.1 acetylornithine deacetylase [Microlunatus capsulatus]
MPENSLPASLPWIERLVAIDTTSRNSNLELIEVLEEEMTRLGLSPERIPDATGTKANLVLTLPASDGSTGGGVVLSGHTDVVPVDGQTWSSDPFTPEVRDGRLYGRGTADMKSFIGVVMHQLPELAAASLAEPVHLAFSYDEEVGCLGGAQIAAALGARPEPPRVCIVGEPSSMRVIAGHKSSNLVELVFHGRSAHSSLTPQGVNAIEYAARAVTAVRDLADRRRAEGPFDEAYVVPFTTAGVNVVSGGIATNTVPELCTVRYEFRTVAEDDPAAVIEEITAVARGLEAEMRAEHPSASVDVRVMAQVPSLDSSPDGPAARLAVELGGTPSGDKVTYGTEAGQFADAGIDAVVCGPGDIAQAHAADEYIELDQVVACEQLVATLVDRLTRTDG